MLKNYILIAWRNLRKNKLFSLLNISGLSIGMAVCILILLFVTYEREFDGLHTKNIYRLNEVQNYGGMVAPQKVALSMFPMGPTLMEEFPEILNYVRIRGGGELRFLLNEKQVTIAENMWADSSFFKIFDFRMIEGNPATALVQPRSIVLTESTSRQLFGSDAPIGKVLYLADQDSAFFTVTGVLEDIPANSHLKFDALTSFSTYVGPQNMENWGGNWLTTYLELPRETDVAALEAKFPAYLKSRMGEQNAKEYELFLQPLGEVHAGSSEISHDYINYQKFDGAYTRIFFFIAIIVLFIAGINFVNLSSAKSIGRAMEIGVRKVSGATRSQLYLQFVGESVLISLVALALAILLVIVALPYLNEFSQRNIDFPLFQSPLLLIGLVLGAALVGVLSGMYPALYLSAFRPIKVLKGAPEAGNRKSGFRNVLVVTQFSAAIFLIIATLFATPSATVYAVQGYRFFPCTGSDDSAQQTNQFQL
jgi:putative ABC transport system permease protein